MADAEDFDFSFGDFKFAPPLQSHVNGVTSTSKNDDVWSDFFLTSLPPKSSSSQSQSKSQFNSSINGLFPSNSTQPTSGLSSIRVDSTPIKAQKPNRALPLSLFGEVEDEDEGSKNNNSNGDLNGWFNPNPPSQNGKFSEDHKKIDSLIKSKNGFGFDFNGAPSDLIVDDNKSKNNNISNGNNIDENEDDVWDFKAAFSSNGNADQGHSKGGAVFNGSHVEPLAMMDQEKQTGQGASNSVDHKPGSISFLPQSTDLFAAAHGDGANHQSSEMDVGFMSATSTTNGFTWDPFPVVENVGNENGTSASLINEDDDFDDFGDFLDASQVVSKDKEPVITRVNLAATQLQNEEVQEKPTQTVHTRGAFPLSLFGDDTEESDDSLNIQNEVVQMPTLSPAKSFSGQSSAVSIQDLISNLYSQTQPTSKYSMGKSAENGVQSSSQVTSTLSLDEDEDEDWDDGSWEFKGAISQNVVGEQLSTTIPENIAKKQPEILLELQSYTEFYDQLRDSLCILLSCQLEELKESQSSHAVTCNGEKADALDDEIQEAFKLLEEVVISEEVLSKDFERYNCLNKLVEALQGTNLNVIESDFSLSKRLQLATSDWRVAAELLRHAISMKKVQSLGSGDEQSIFISTWSKIISVCVQELRYGALLWKRASEEDVQHQILSDSQGQLYIQALGEIYKVAALLALSAKLYKPWILRSFSTSSQIFAILKDCDGLWSNSGLEEAIQKLSDNVTFGCSETAKAAIASIKNIRDIDALPVHDRIFSQHKSLCRLSLLPQEIIADLKTVMWGEEAYFVNLANLWANLISCNPPQLPHLEVKVE